MLSKKCQYALHALKFMASRPVGETVNIKDIIEHEDMPRKFLERIMADMKSVGILYSERGYKGGYSFRRDPSQVSLLEVVRVFDGAVAMLPCVSLHFYHACGFCKDEATCSIKLIFSKVRDATLKILSSTTVADLNSFPLDNLLQETRKADIA
jgi:Rrf2 family protein